MKTQVEISAQNKTDAAFNSFIRNINNAERNMQGFNGSLGSVAASFKNMLSNVPFMLTAMATTAVASFGAMIKNAVNTADEYYKLSQQIGLTTEAISTMAYSVKLSGMTMEDFYTSLLRFNRYLAETGKTSKTVEQSLLDFADKFANTETGAKKTAMAMEAFGRSGAKMIPFLNQGSEGIKDMQQRARDLGLEIDTNTAMAAERFNDSLEDIKLSLEGIATKTLPPLLAMMDRLTFAWYMFQGLTSAKGAAIWLSIYQQGIEKTYEAFIKGMDNQREATKALKEGQAELLKDEREREALLRRQAQEAERMKKQWEFTQKSFEKDIMKQRLSEINYQVWELTERMTNLKTTFGDSKEIDVWYNSMLNAILKLNEASVRGVDTESNLPKDFSMMPIDTTIYDFQIEKSIEVTNWELANLAIRQEATQDMFGNMADAASNFYDLSGQKSKEMFAVYKAFAIGQTAIATYESAVKAYNSLVGIPIIGPALAVAAAASAVAFGLSNIAKISAATPGSGASGGSASAPSIPNPNSLRGGEAEGGKGNITINVYGSIVDHGKFAREILPALEDAYSDLGGG